MREIYGKEERVERADVSRKKTESAERSTHMKVLLKLKQQEEVIEKGFVSAIHNMKIRTDILQDILYDYHKTTTISENFADALHKNVRDIVAEMTFAKRAMEDLEEMQKLDVIVYKQKLLKLSQRIQEFKQSCPLQALGNEQIILQTELKDLESNLQKFSSTQNLTCLQLASHESKGQSRFDTDYKEIDNFHTLVAKTGHTGNWSGEDHLLFLRMRKKCNSIPALVTAIQAKYPDLSAETIVNHESWYKVYLALREKQKSTVKEWRKQKELARAKEIEVKKNNMGNLSRDVVPFANEALNKEKTVRTGLKVPRKIVSTWTEYTNENEQDTKKELIRKWRVEKENKRIMDLQQIEIQVQMKREFQDAQRKRRLRKMQEALSEYKRRKSAEANLKKSGEMKMEKRKCDTTLLKAFRKQDQEYAKSRRKLILRLKEPHNNSFRKASLESQRMRSCSTLFSSTKVWNEKRRFSVPVKNLSTNILYIKDVPKMCTKWRNEESIDLKNSLMVL